MSTTVRRRGVSVDALMLAPGSVRSSVQSGWPRRARPARGPRDRAADRRRRAWTAAGRSSREPSAARIETRLVSVPKPEPGSATSLATSRSAPLRRSFSAARSREPVSAANPTMTGTGPKRLAGRARPRCRARARSGRSRRGGPASARARGSGCRLARACGSAGATGRKSATAAAMTRASNPAEPSAAWVDRSSAARRSAVDSTRTTVGAVGQCHLHARRR